MKSTIICIPTYNEVENIQTIIPAVFEFVPTAHILVIDDNSPDGTGAIADQMASHDDRIFVLHRTQKEGLGPAYIAGFRWALERDYDYVLEMDADFSHQPRYVPTLISGLQTHDVVVGSRYVTGGGTQNWGLLRRGISKGGGVYARAILGVAVQDITAGFVAWRAEVLRALDLARIGASGYVFQIEMKYRALQSGFQILEVPITFPDREVGVSKMTPRIAAEAVLRVWEIKLRS